MQPEKDHKKVQGEGDYKSDKRYTESVQSFVKSGKVDSAASNAFTWCSMNARSLGSCVGLPAR